MNGKLFNYLSEFLIVLALFMSNIQFLLFSLIGIDYDPEEGGGLVAQIGIGCFIYTMIWIAYHEMKQIPINHVRWPYFIVFIPVFLFFIEMVLYGLNLQIFAGRQFSFYCVYSIPSIYLATYIYRYERFDMITRNLDIIMIICTLALILNLPYMFLHSGLASIAGAGGHQDISYGAAFCFAINLVSLLSGNESDRFPIFNRKYMKIAFFALLPIQALICFLGGGRGGSLMVIIAIIVSFYIYSNQHFVRSLFGFTVALFAFIIIINNNSLFSSGIGRAFDYIQGGELDLVSNESDVIRTTLRERSFQLISDSPFLGYGLWNGLKVAGYYMHNVFLDVLISGGIIYFAFFILCMNKAYSSALNILKKDNTRCMLLPLLLYPTTVLMFSGFYLKSGIFMFCICYTVLNRKQYKY